MTGLPFDAFDYDPMVATIDRLPADWQALLREKWKRAGLPALKGPNVRAFTEAEVVQAKELVETTKRRAAVSDELRRRRVMVALAERGVRTLQDAAEAIEAATKGEATSTKGLTWEQVEAVEIWCELHLQQREENNETARSA